MDNPVKKKIIRVETIMSCSGCLMQDENNCNKFIKIMELIGIGGCISYDENGFQNGDFIYKLINDIQEPQNL